MMLTRLTFLTLLACVSLCTQGCERKLAVRESDKTLFLRAQDLVDYGYGFQGIEKYETFSKARDFEGSYDLEYRFETPESEEDDPLFMHVSVTVSKEKSDAKLNQGAEKIGILYGLKSQGIEKEEIPNFYQYGDSSSFYLLKREGQPIGNYFTVREGSKTYTIILSGVFFDDPEVWKELIEPKLKQFSVYKP